LTKTRLHNPRLARWSAEAPLSRGAPTPSFAVSPH